jgi:hypothetical protein
MKLAVYTTYCGATERATFKPRPIDERYPHYLISNNENYLDTVSKSFNFRPIFLNAHLDSCPILSAKQSKIAKILPNTFQELNQYDYLLYYDDKLQLNLDRIEETLETLEVFNSPIAFRKHPSIPDTNVLFDLAEAMYQWRYRADWESLIKYITEEVEAGFKLKANRYFATGIILRNMRHNNAIKINELWYEHTMRSSAVCQISLHFARQRFKDKFLTLPENIVKY